MDFTTIILIPFLVGLITNRVDAIVVAPVVENVLKRLWQDDKRVHEELEKTIKCCFFAALQTIALECHREILGSAPVQRYRGVVIYPVENQKELQWLDRTIQQLTLDIKKIRVGKSTEISLPSIDDIASLLTTEGKVAEDRIQPLRDKFIAETLKHDYVPEYYIARVKATLLEKVHGKLLGEAKHNPNIKNLLKKKLIEYINANVIDKKLKIQNIEDFLYPYRASELQLLEARRKIKLEFNIENIDAPKLEAIVQHLQELLGDGSLKLMRIEEGCMELIFDGSQKSLEKLDALFKSGQLQEILGTPVQDVRSEEVNSSLAQSLVNLEQWLQNIIDTNWYTLQEVLGEKKLVVAVARSNTSFEGVLRAQRIDLENELTGTSLALLVTVQATADETRDILLEVHPLSSTNLPLNLKCFIVDTFGKVIKEDQTKKDDKFIKLKISGKTGENFSLQIEVGKTSTTRNFLI